MALPNVSAVMPVPSETKNTVRVCMGLPVELTDSARPQTHRPAYNGGNYPFPHLMQRPGPFEEAKSPLALHAALLCPSADPVSTFGVFPCLHFSAHCPWRIA